MTTRRKFFGLMAATPLAAKVAADTAVIYDSGSSAGGTSYFGRAGIPVKDIETAFGATEDSYRAKKFKNIIGVGDYIDAVGPPGFLEEMVREITYHVACFDPDIANKKSWSPAVKFATQRQRNYDRMMMMYVKAAKRGRAQQILENALGLAWPNDLQVTSY